MTQQTHLSAQSLCVSGLWEHSNLIFCISFSSKAGSRAPARVRSPLNAQVKKTWLPCSCSCQLRASVSTKSPAFQHSHLLHDHHKRRHSPDKNYITIFCVINHKMTFPTHLLYLIILVDREEKCRESWLFPNKHFPVFLHQQNLSVLAGKLVIYRPCFPKPSMKRHH